MNLVIKTSYGNNIAYRYGRYFSDFYSPFLLGFEWWVLCDSIGPLLTPGFDAMFLFHVIYCPQISEIAFEKVLVWVISVLTNFQKTWKGTASTLTEFTLPLHIFLIIVAYASTHVSSTKTQKQALQRLCAYRCECLFSWHLLSANHRNCFWKGAGLSNVSPNQLSENMKRDSQHAHWIHPPSSHFPNNCGLRIHSC